MFRKKASDYPQEILTLYDEYVHGGINRRDFLDRSAKFAVGGIAAAALLDELTPNYALARQVPLDDARVVNEYVTYPSPQGHGTIRAYLSRPAGVTSRLPAVVVVHENRGLNPYIEDVARRLGTAGYLALAPDGLTPAGGYPGDDDQGRQMQASLDAGKLMEDFMAAVTHMLSHPGSTGRVGIVGFCYGGGVSNTAAVRIPELAAAVPFYGRQAPAADVPKIRAELLIHYAETDPGINAGAAAYEEALRANGKRFAAHVYPGTQHGFHNDTTPRYDEAAAKLAWERTLEFFGRTLGQRQA